jgi:hypothetical protein
VIGELFKTRGLLVRQQTQAMPTRQNERPSISEYPCRHEMTAGFKPGGIGNQRLDRCGRDCANTRCMARIDTEVSFERRGTVGQFDMKL